MKLVRIEAAGFKSFADNVVFELGAGVTAFVGPNGCGKSNVVDAIRWALGEQSVKALRGKDMADVIFNGCQGRPAAGAAEVTLVFDNADGRLAVPHAEVAVTRRLYRSGESEYLVNKEPCRLRDIREMFLDTGIGVDAYSVIQQGQIDRLLHASNQERREIFEEAAGISRYRVKCRQATARLERVDQNLLRIRDLVRELERQLRSIRRQAARARRAKELQEEYRTARLALALHRRHELKEAGSRIDARRAEAETALREIEAARLALEGVLAEANARRDEIARGAQELAVAIARDEAGIRAIDEHVAGVAARRVEAERESAALVGQETAARAAAAGALAKASAVETELAPLAADVARREEEARHMEARAAGLRAEVEAALKLAEGKRNEAMEAVRGRIALEGERVGCERQIESLAAQAARSREKAASAEGLLPAALRAAEGAAAFLQELSGERQRLAAKAGYFREEIERAAGEDALKHAEAEVLNYRRKEAESRRERLVAAHADPAEILGGEAVGRLRDFVHAPVGTFHAIESALGIHATDWVVKDLSGALRVVDRASHMRWPETGVFPVDRAEGASAAPSPAQGPGVLGWAIDLVEADAGMRGVMGAVLSGTLVVEDRAVALAAIARGDVRRAVTLAGEVFDATGAIHYRNETARGNDVPEGISRRHLEEEIVRIAAAVEQLEARRAELRAAREESQKILEEVERGIAGLDRQISEARGTLDHETARGREIARERELSLAEADALDAERAALAEKLAALGGRLAAIPEGTPGDPEASGGEPPIDDSASSAWKRAEEELKGARAALAGLEERLREGQRSVEAFRQEASRQEAEAARLAEAAGALARRMAQESNDADAKLRHKEGIAAQLAGARARAGEIDGAAREIRERIASLESERASRQKTEEEARARANEVRMEERELGLRLAGEAERLKEDLQVDLEEAAAGYADAPADWEAVARRVEELKAELARTGGVDLEALSEEEELERRHSFLGAQEADLTRAREGLSDLIRKMNKTSRERFTETFERIRVNFQEAFRKLFGGGKADIRLEEEADVLEAGIEIVAQPPGKQPRSISLLSGGEKSMTAVALLFAVFQSRPSPFCILDEADAALDETNIDRFVGIVKEFLVTSQFLVITHNKRTMRIADRLYGLTQQVPGISIPVSLTFEEIEKN